MSLTNGHATNGFGSSDDESDLSSEEEEEEHVGANGTAMTPVNGHTIGVSSDEEKEGSDEINDEDSDDDNEQIKNDDDDSDSDSAPEDISFKTGRDTFQQKSQQQQQQIEKSLTAAKERRRRRDEQLKQQKATKLKKLKESKLSADFLQSLDSEAPPVDPLSSVVSPDPSAPTIAVDPNANETKKRKLIPLPDVEGVEFEVVVGNSNADTEIMNRVNRYVKKHVQPKSVPRLSAKRKKSLNAKRSFLKSRR